MESKDKCTCYDNDIGVMKCDYCKKIGEEICENCGKPKGRHYEAPILEGEKKIFECEIVRDSGKNYRFKKIKSKMSKDNSAKNKCKYGRKHHRYIPTEYEFVYENKRKERYDYCLECGKSK